MGKTDDITLQDKIKIEGIQSLGYGIMPKAVSKDKRLSIEAKAIYAYFVSYAGAGTSAFPSLKTILADLNISENRFYKHRKFLIDFGYISVNAERKGKIITKNVYTLHTNPKNSEKEDVSSDLKDNLSSDLKDNPILQNEGGRILTKNNINKRQDDDEIFINKSDQSINRLKEIFSERQDLKYLAQELYQINVSENEIVKILNYFVESGTALNPEAVEQQLNWMSVKNKTSKGISSYSVYFIAGYENRTKNLNIDKNIDVCVSLKNSLQVSEEEPLPTIPMYNWLLNS